MLSFKNKMQEIQAIPSDDTCKYSSSKAIISHLQRLVSEIKEDEVIQKLSAESLSDQSKSAENTAISCDAIEILLEIKQLILQVLEKEKDKPHFFERSAIESPNARSDLEVRIESTLTELDTQSYHCNDLSKALYLLATISNISRIIDDELVDVFFEVNLIDFCVKFIEKSFPSKPNAKPKDIYTCYFMRLLELILLRHEEGSFQLEKHMKSNQRFLLNIYKTYDLFTSADNKCHVLSLLNTVIHQCSDESHQFSETFLIKVCSEINTTENDLIFCQALVCLTTLSWNDKYEHIVSMHASTVVKKMVTKLSSENDKIVLKILQCFMKLLQNGTGIRHCVVFEGYANHVQRLLGHQNKDIVHSTLATLNILLSEGVRGLQTFFFQETDVATLLVNCLHSKNPSLATEALFVILNFLNETPSLKEKSEVLSSTAILKGLVDCLTAERKHMDDGRRIYKSMLMDVFEIIIEYVSEPFKQPYCQFAVERKQCLNNLNQFECEKGLQFLSEKPGFFAFQKLSNRYNIIGKL